MGFSEVFRSTILNSMSELWVGVLAIVPKILVALFVAFAGWLVAVLIGRVVRGFVDSIKLDKFLETIGFDEVLARTGFGLNSGLFFGELAKWFFIILFLKISLDIVSLQQVNDFLTQVLLYIPNVVVATLILFAGALLSSAVRSAINKSLVKAHSSVANFASHFSAVVIWIFAIVAALGQLGVNTSILNAVVIGLVASISLAVGLSFGLGGRKHAEKILDYVEDQLRG